MTRAVEVAERVGQWSEAYGAIRDSLTPDDLRVLTKMANEDPNQPSNVAAIQLGIMAAKIVFANDRAAATVAAMLVATGIKPVAVDYGYGDDGAQP